MMEWLMKIRSNNQLFRFLRGDTEWAAIKELKKLKWDVVVCFGLMIRREQNISHSFFFVVSSYSVTFRTTFGTAAPLPLKISIGECATFCGPWRRTRQVSAPLKRLLLISWVVEMFLFFIVGVFINIIIIGVPHLPLIRRGDELIAEQSCLVLSFFVH